MQIQYAVAPFQRRIILIRIKKILNETVFAPSKYEIDEYITQKSLHMNKRKTDSIVEYMWF